MKTMGSLSLFWLILAGATAVVSGEEFRTDINPAMHYYQGFILAPDLSKADRDYMFEKEWRGQKHRHDSPRDRNWVHWPSAMGHGLAYRLAKRREAV